MSPLPKGYIRLKPSFFRMLHPNLKDGVIVDIIRDTVKYLPRPLGRRLWKNKQIRGFNPFQEWTYL